MHRSSFHGSGVTLQPPRSILNAAPTVNSSSFMITRCQRDPIDDRRDSHNHASSQTTPTRPRFRRSHTGGLDQKSQIRSPELQGTVTAFPPLSPSSTHYSERRNHSGSNGGSTTPRTGRFRNNSGRLRHNNNNNNNSNGGNSHQSHQVRRWLVDLAKDLKDVLPKDYDEKDGIDPEIAEKVLSMVPQSNMAGIHQGGGAGGDGMELATRVTTGEDSGNSKDRTASSPLSINGVVADLLSGSSAGMPTSGTEESQQGDFTPPQSVYNAELEAILHHYKASQEDLPPVVRKEAASVE